MRRYILSAAIAGLLVAVAVAAFGVTRQLRDQEIEQVSAQPTSPTPAPSGRTGPASPGPVPSAPGPVPSSPGPAPAPPQPTPPAAVPANLPLNPDTSQPEWYVPYLNAERLKPVVNQTLNGITIGPSVEHRFDVTCRPGSARQVPIDQAAGSPVIITAKYIPTGAKQFEALATVCETSAGQTVVVETNLAYSIPPGPTAGRSGGVVTITRWQGAPSASVSIPADRWAIGNVSGRPAAIARPILPNGLGQSAIVVYANGIVTKIEAAWLPLDEVQRIAAGLF